MCLRKKKDDTFLCGSEVYFYIVKAITHQAIEGLMANIQEQWENKMIWQ